MALVGVALAATLAGCGQTAEPAPTKSPTPTAEAKQKAEKELTEAEQEFEDALEKAEKQVEKYHNGLKVDCRKLVRRNLKAPATAAFSGEKVKVTGNGLRVVGKVDAENSFSALLRMEYKCVVKDDYIELKYLREG